MKQAEYLLPVAVFMSSSVLYVSSSVTAEYWTSNKNLLKLKIPG